MKKININFSRISVRIAFSILSGILTFLAFPPFDIAFMGWFCLVPLLMALKESTLKESILLGYVAGIVFFSGLLYWLVNVTIPGTLIAVIYLAIFFCIFGFAARFIVRRSMELLILPFIWVILEFIRGNLFTGFPWGLLGYSQYQNLSLIQIADFTGAYGISFILVSFNVAVFAWITKSKRKVSYMMVALLFIVMSMSYARYKLDKYDVWSSPKVSVVQGNIPQELKWDEAQAADIFSIYEGLSIKAAAEKPDIIIWPETAFPYLFEKDIYPAEELNVLTEKIEIPILAGCVMKEKEDYFNTALLFDKGKDTCSYNKTHLVPFGEYIPSKWLNDLLRKFIDKPIGDFVKGKEYKLFSMKGTSVFSADDQIMKTTNYYKFGVLICFEDIFPYLARKFVKGGANFLVNITNDAWFNKTGASRQHLQSSVFRAVENRVPVVRSANTGISCFIDSTGKIESILQDSGEEIFVRGMLSGKVDICRWRSFYTYYGDTFVLFCVVMVVILFLTEGYFLISENKKK